MQFCHTAYQKDINSKIVNRFDFLFLRKDEQSGSTLKY